MPDDKRKVAILGGGPSAITCAYELSLTKELQDQYEVTVYQPGHRLGGKCASGRDDANHHRILEHGLHIWFGFYDNAIQLMRDVYEAVDRPEGAPLRTFEDAFKPCGDIIVYETWKDRWIPRRLHFPENPVDVGRSEAWFMLGGAIGWLLGHHKADNIAEKVAFKALRKVAEEIEELGDKVADDMIDVVGYLLCKLRDLAWDRVQDDMDDDETRFWFQNLDIAAAVVRGIGKDDLLINGTESIDHLEFSEWLTKHGIHEQTLKHSPVIIGVYDSSFAYVDGDIHSGRNMAAGTALRDTLRTLFGHKGAFFYKMSSGMGDVVFAPMYKLLQDRGVKFEFFHAVSEMRPDEGLTCLDEIDIMRQVELSGAAYDPLYDVKGLPCWPHHPLWDQLADGAELAKRPPDFEHSPDPLGRADKRTLKAGVDFDDVVMAFPPDVQRQVCGPLISELPDYRNMLAHLHTVTTQAFQVWFDRPLDQLGWKWSEDSITGSFVEPLDTWSSMTQTAGTECDEHCKAIVYCCGVMPLELDSDAEAGHAQAKANMEEYLTRDAPVMWPDLRPEHIRGTYARSNQQAAERYVLSVAGTIEHRRWPGEEELPNLFFAGDWTHNPLDAGCVEGAVTSGMQAAQAITGLEMDISGVDGWLNASPQRSKRPVPA